ncbi:MAG: protein O-mannosyl-transferase family [Patescibacteria group bacterium]
MFQKLVKDLRKVSYSSLSARSLATILILLAGLVYGATVARTHVSFADSDELTVVGYLGGVAHPPGYPLLVSLIYGFTHLPLPIEVALKANILAAVIQLANIILIFFITKTLIFRVIGESNIASIAAFFGSLTTAFSAYVWFQANVIEKYSLVVLLILLSYSLALKVSRSGFNWIFLGLIVGLGLTYHEIFWLWLPFLFFQLFSSWKEILCSFKNIYLFVLATIIGITLNLTLLWFFNQQILPFSFNFPSSFNGIVNHLLRGEYALTGSIYLSSSSFFQPDKAVEHFIGNTVKSFLLLPLLIAIYGWHQSFQRKKYRTTFTLLGCFLFFGVGLVVYIGYPGFDPNSTAIYFEQLVMLERFYLISHIFLGISIGFGTAFLMQKFVNKIMSVLLIFGVWIVIQASYLRQHVDLSTFTQTEQLARHILSDTPANTLVVTHGDYASFSLQYASLVSKIRPDVDVKLVNFRYQQLDRQDKTLTRFNFPLNPEYTLDLVSNNIYKRPVVAVDLNSAYYQHLGLTEGVYFASAQNQALRLYSTIEELKDTEVVPEPKVWQVNTASFLPFFTYVNTLQSERLAISGYFLVQRGSYKEASQYLLEAKSLHPYKFYPFAEQQFTNPQPNAFYTEKVKMPELSDFMSASLDAQNAGDLLLARSYATGAFLRNPDNPETWRLLSEINLKLGDDDRGKVFLSKY